MVPKPLSIYNSHTTSFNASSKFWLSKKKLKFLRFFKRLHAEKVNRIKFCEIKFSENKNSRNYLNLISRVNDLENFAREPENVHFWRRIEGFSQFSWWKMQLQTTNVDLISRISDSKWFYEIYFRGIAKVNLILK